MSSNGWETVVNKKKGQITKTDVKQAQQNFKNGGSNIPKISTRDPLMLEKTMFEAGFKEKDVDEKVPSIVPVDLSSDENNTRSPRMNHQRKKKVPKTVPVFNMEEKIKAINVKELKEKIADIKKNFPEHQLIWLKETASWLQVQLQGPNEKSDLAYLNKSKAYPSNAVQEEVRCTLISLMKKCEKNVLNSFFVFLLACLSDEIQKGHSTAAFRIFIQLIADVRPSVFVDNCNEIVQGKSRNGDAYLAVIWAFSQGKNNTKDGLKIWWSSMFDGVLDKKYHAVASMRYLDALLSNVDMTKVQSPLITPEEMLHLIETMTSENSSLAHTPSLMEDLSKHYNTFKSFLFGKPSSNTFKVCFTNILPSLRNRTEGKEMNMICKLLVEILSESNVCMEWWMENFVHLMRESSVLLKYMQSNSVQVVKKLTEKRQYKSSVLGTTASVALGHLEKANEKGRFEKKAGFKDCKRICGSFIRADMEAKRQRSRMWTMLKLVFLIMVGLSIADVYKSGSYKKSTTGKYMKKYGVEDKLFVALKFTQQYTDQAQAYCGKHLPYYYSKFSYYADPVMGKSWEYLSIGGKFVYKHSEPLRMYANEVLPPLFEKMSFFINEQYRIISTIVIDSYTHYTPIVMEFLTSTYEWLSTSIPLAYKNSLEALQTAKTKIYQLSPETFDRIQVILMDVYNYLCKMTPVAVDAVRLYTTKCVDSTRGFVHQGQMWMNQHMSAMPSK